MKFALWSASRNAGSIALAVASLLFVPATSSAKDAGAPAAEQGEEDEQAKAAERKQVLDRLREEAGALMEEGGRGDLAALDDQAFEKVLEAPSVEALGEKERAVREAAGKAMFERELKYEKGDIQVGDGLATLHLGEDFRYLNPADTERLLVEGWGNPPGSKTLGMIVPGGVSPLHQEKGWAVVVTYSEDGYVEDDDADEIDYDELLAQMKEDTLASNEQRQAQGYGTVELVGWAAAPHYEAASHRLYWAKELKFSGGTENTLNYAIRVLGRKGVLELNAVAGMSQLGSIRGEMEKVLPRAEFAVGSRYADFDPEIDQVAAYGIGGLIAGKVLAKAGFFAGLLKLLIAGKKLILIGVFAIGALLAKFFRGRSTTAAGDGG